MSLLCNVLCGQSAWNDHTVQIWSRHFSDIWISYSWNRWHVKQICLEGNCMWNYIQWGVYLIRQNKNYFCLVCSVIAWIQYNNTLTIETCKITSIHLELHRPNCTYPLHVILIYIARFKLWTLVCAWSETKGPGMYLHITGLMLVSVNHTLWPNFLLWRIKICFVWYVMKLY